MQEYVDWIVTYDSAEEAFFIARGLPRVLARYPQLTSRPSELAQGYERILALTRAAALPRLNDEEIKAFLQKGIVTAVRVSEIDLIGKITAKLVQIPWVEDRDEYRKKLRFELRQNFERLTLQSIRTTVGAVPPTVKEWMALAEKAALENEPLTSAIFTDKTFKALSRSEQTVVQRILAIDDFLSLSSASPEGFELATTVVDENGQRLVLEGGEVRPAADPQSEQLLKKYFAIFEGQGAAPAPTGRRPESTFETAKTAAELRSLISGAQREGRLDDEARYEAQETLLRTVGTDVAALVKRLEQALLVNDNAAVLASLGVLSRFGSLDSALQSASIREVFTQEFLKPLAASAKVSLDVVKAMLNRSTKQPQFVAGFLQWALDRALLKNSTESARIGNQFGNTLAALGDPSYVAMTYFDVKSGSFKWTPLKMKADGMLEWVG